MNIQTVYLCDMFCSDIISRSLHYRMLNSDSDFFKSTDISLKTMKLECSNVPNIIISTVQLFMMYMIYNMYFQLHLCILLRTIILLTTYNMYMYSETYFYMSNMN